MPKPASPRGDYPLSILSVFRIKSRGIGNEKRVSGSRDHRRQRPLSTRKITRSDRTRDRYTIRSAVGHACWRKSKRASGLFFAAPRPRAPDSASRNKSPGQHLCAPFAQRPLDYLGGGRMQITEKICAARRVV